MKEQIRKITRPVHKLYQTTPHIEHGGFVALAATEVFHLGAWLFAINVVLLCSGAAAICFETFHVWAESGVDAV